MANQKATKKTTKEAKTRSQLQQELDSKRADLLEARRSHAAGELVNPRVLTSTKKEIARLLTAIRAVESSEKETT